MANYSVRIGDKVYYSETGKPIIDAIPESEVIKGCLKGVCRVCRCRLVSGSVLEKGKTVTHNAEFLPCVSKAETDIALTPSISNFQTAVIERKTYLSAKVIEIVLKVKTAFYNAKSVVTLKHPESSAVRSYSVVTLGKKSYDTLRLHIKLRDDGVFSRLFQAVPVGCELEYFLVNPLTPQYDSLLQRVNVVSAGSGMGAALSRAQELAKNYRIKEATIYAINRADISDYHLNCINTFIENTECEVRIFNIPFQDWINDSFNIQENLASGTLTIGVGSNRVIEKLQSLPFCELESFG